MKRLALWLGIAILVVSPGRRRYDNTAGHVEPCQGRDCTAAGTPTLGPASSGSRRPATRRRSSTWAAWRRRDGRLQGSSAPPSPGIGSPPSRATPSRRRGWARTTSRAPASLRATRRRRGGRGWPPSRATAVPPTTSPSSTARAARGWRQTPAKRRSGARSRWPRAFPIRSRTPRPSPSTPRRRSPFSRRAALLQGRRHGPGRADVPALRGHGRRRLPAAVGWHYDVGKGIARSDAEAVRWYRAAADQYIPRRRVQPRQHVPVRARRIQELSHRRRVVRRVLATQLSARPLRPRPDVPVRLRREGGPGQGPRALSSVGRHSATTRRARRWPPSTTSSGPTSARATST